MNSTFKWQISNKNYNTAPIHNPDYSNSENSEDEGMDNHKIEGYHSCHVG